MHRADVEIRFESVAPGDIRTQVVAHHRSQPYVGDFFMGHHQLSGEAARVIVNGVEAGVTASHEGQLTYFKLDKPHRRLHRQALEAHLDASGLSRAYVASWDLHHVDLIGGFASTIRPQAYQFELLDESSLREPVDGLALRVAGRDDLAYLTAQDFLDDYDEPLRKGEVRIAERHGSPVGIGLSVANGINDNAVDIGMYADPAARRQGVGSSIVALLAREARVAGKRVAAGCWWQNWGSRPSLESAGLTCVGTIFHLQLDATRFSATETLS